MADRQRADARADCAVVMLGVSFSLEHFMLRTFVKRLIAVTVLSKESSEYETPSRAAAERGPTSVRYAYFNTASG
jgi:hypothetical protein